MPAPDRPAVFLDRDGTLIEDVGHPRDPDAVRLLQGAPEALRELERGGFLLVLVSNQSGARRGLVSPEEAAAVAARFVECLGAQGVRLHAAYYCPHAPGEGCPCRKPAPGMLLRAAAELGIDLGRSFMVGDKPSDVEAGKRAGCRTVHLSFPPGEGTEALADCTARSWGEAVRFVLGLQGQMAAPGAGA